MKKLAAILFSLILCLILAATTVTAAVPVYGGKDGPAHSSDGVTPDINDQGTVTENTRDNTRVIGYITFTFADQGTPEYPQKTVTTRIYENKPNSDDDVMESWLKSLYRSGQQGDVLRIDAVDGVSIADTKWAKYGGEIKVTNPYLGGRNPDGVPYKNLDGTDMYHGFAIKSNYAIPIETFQKAYYDAGYRDDAAANRIGAAGQTPNGQTNGEDTYQYKDVQVVINNDPVTFPDAKPYIDVAAERTLVPMRAVFEHFWVQATVLWDAKNRTVTATNREGKIVIFKIDEKSVTLIDTNGKVTKTEIDVAPTIKEDRTYLPLRALAETLTMKVDWFADTKTVQIKSTDEYKKTLMPRRDWGVYVNGFNAEHAN